MADDDRSPDDDLPELFRQLFGQAGMGGEQFAELQKMGFDPAMLQRAMQQLQGAFASAGEGGPRPSRPSGCPALRARAPPRPESRRERLAAVAEQQTGPSVGM